MCNLIIIILHLQHPSIWDVNIRLRGICHSQIEEVAIDVGNIKIVETIRIKPCRVYRGLQCLEYINLISLKGFLL